MKDSLLTRLDTINLYEYNIQYNHNCDIDLPYNDNIIIYVIGYILYVSYIIKTSK